MTSKIINTAIGGQLPEFDINGFTASHLIFDESHFATLWAKCRINGLVQDVHLIIGFEKLNDMLRFSGEKGEKILLNMVDAMMHQQQLPYIISFKELFDTDAIFTNIKLKVFETKSDDLLKSDDSCWFVNEVWPINIIEQAKNLEQQSKDFKTTAIISENIMLNSLLQLKEMYHYYLGLIDLDLNEDAARSRAQLSDNRLFAMARSAGGL